MEKKKSALNWQWVLGFMLVVTGGLFLADQFLEVEIMRQFWPLLIAFFGLMFLVAMLVAGKKAAWLAIPACFLITLGLLFFIQNTFDLWATWTYAWGLLISAVGLGLLIMNIYYKKLGLRRGAGVVIGVGLLLFVIFGILFQIILKITGMDLESGIFLGSGLVLLGLFVIFSGPIFTEKVKPEVIEPTEDVVTPVEVPAAVAEEVPAPEEEPEPEEAPQLVEEPIFVEETVSEEPPAFVEEPLLEEVPGWVEEPSLEEVTESVEETISEELPGEGEEIALDEIFKLDDEPFQDESGHQP